MTLQTDLEQAVARAKTDSDRLKEIVNGPADGTDSTVAVDSGPVKTVARAIAEIGDTSNQALKDLANVAPADLAARLRAAGEGTGFRATPAAPADLTVTVAPGIVPRPDLLPLAVDEQIVGPFVAPIADSRNDLVHIDRLTGAVGVAEGTEAAEPIDPDLPAGTRPVARARLVPGMTEIGAGDLDDLRDGLVGHGTAISRDAGTGAHELPPLDAEGRLPGVDGGNLAGLLKPGPREYMIAASLVHPAVGQGCGPVESLAMGAGRPDLVYRAFDAAVTEAGMLLLPLPKSWDRGAVSCQVVWTHGAADTSFGVVWSLAGVAVGDGESAEAALGDAVELADEGGTADDIQVTPWSAPIAIAGTPGEGDLVLLRLARNVAAAGDTLAAEARLIAMRLRIVLNEGNDA